MNESPVLYERQGRIAQITLNRPQVINAFDRAMYEELNSAIETFRDDEEAWVAIITGAGERGFSSGADIKSLAAEKEAGITAPLPPILFCEEMVTPKPIVAAVCGHCIGEGVNVVLACDLVIAEETSRFYVPEARIDINAIDIPLKLAQKVGYAQAFELLMGLEPKSAAWCMSAGLVNQVVQKGEAKSRAISWANRLVDETAPLAIRAMKETLWQAVLEDKVQARIAAMQWRERLLRSQDWAEGQASFIEKRKPKYVGK